MCERRVKERLYEISYRLSNHPQWRRFSKNPLIYSMNADCACNNKIIIKNKLQHIFELIFLKKLN